jgi:hypothetical protein
MRMGLQWPAVLWQLPTARGRARAHEALHKWRLRTGAHRDDGGGDSGNMRWDGVKLSTAMIPRQEARVGNKDPFPHQIKPMHGGRAH